MAEITAGLVKQLREKTGAGMMDCKKALTENAGDIEAAEDWLRKKGISTAAKKAGRTAAQGLVGVVTQGTSGAIVEINAETDFVGRDETFKGFVSEVTKLALEAKGDIEALKAMAYPGTGRSVADELTQLIARIGENMAIRRCTFLSVEQGVVAAYMHNKVADGLGTNGVLVALESAGDPTKLGALGKNLAMHISFADPHSIDTDGVDPALVERERNILVEQARASGKPEEIVQKMVDGRLRKFYEEICLLEQTYAIDNETKVRKVLDQVGTELGAAIKVAGFQRYKLGEGIERGPETDFAAEVAAQLA